MVKKYSDLYLDARKALLPVEGQQRAGLLARELGYLYVDTGAIYRTVALRCKQAGADPADPVQVAPCWRGWTCGWLTGRRRTAYVLVG